jgi:SAM-dependent methyltransferase
LPPRHSSRERALSQRGYSAIGIDRDADVIAKARGLARGPTYLNADVRDYHPNPGAFDLAMIMSQSFGYFDPATNGEVLGRLTNGVRDGGRVILDLWSSDFFVAHQGRYGLKTASGVVRETNSVEEGRLFVHLDYPGGGGDNFEWQLFSPAQMTSMAESVGLRQLFACTDFDGVTPPSRMSSCTQFVFERRRLR